MSAVVASGDEESGSSTSILLTSDDDSTRTPQLLASLSKVAVIVSDLSVVGNT